MAPCLCARVCSYKASVLAFLAIAILSLLLGCGFLFTKQPSITHNNDQSGHTAYRIPGLAVHVLQEHGVFLPAHDNGKELAHPIAAATSTLLQLEYGVSKEGAALFDSAPQEENAFLLDDGKQQSTSTVSKEDAALFDTVPQKENAFLLDDGKQQSAPEEEIKLVSVSKKDAALSDNVPQEENAFLLDDGKQQSATEEDINLPLITPENKIKMVGSNDDDLQQEAAAKPHESMPKIRMVGTSAKILQKLQNPPAGAGRSRSCSSNPKVCQDPRIALYGQRPTPRRGPESPACCDGVCVDLDTNPAHCGSCRRKCSLMEACCNGQCTDLSKDSSNCGHCGHSCSPFIPCQFGMCGYY